MRPCIRPRPFYHEEMQNRAEKLGGILISVGDQGILSAPVCACLRLSACVGAQADALAHRLMRWRTGRFGSGHAGLAL